MHVKSSSLMLLLLLCACGPTAEEPANQAEPAASQPARSEQEKRVIPSLAGQWTVTHINQAAPRQTWPLEAAVTDSRLTLQSECVRMAWDYRQDGNIVQFTSVPVESCERVLSPAEEMVSEPIGLANIAMFSNEGREVLLSGPGGTVAMRRR